MGLTVRFAADPRPGFCADVIDCLQQQQQALGSVAPPHPTVLPMPQSGGFPGVGNGGLPGAGLLPQDGQIVAVIAQQCGGNPALHDRSVGHGGSTTVPERSRGSRGMFWAKWRNNEGDQSRCTPNLQPNVLTNNVAHDIQHGPGPNNDLVGCNGAVNKLFGGHC